MSVVEQIIRTAKALPPRPVPMPDHVLISEGCVEILPRNGPADVQVFQGTPEQLIAALAKAQGHATAKIRELSEQLRQRDGLLRQMFAFIAALGKCRNSDQLKSFPGQWCQTLSWMERSDCRIRGFSTRVTIGASSSVVSFK